MQFSIPPLNQLRNRYEQLHPPFLPCYAHYFYYSDPHCQKTTLAGIVVTPLEKAIKKGMKDSAPNRLVTPFIRKNHSIKLGSETTA